MGEVPRVVHVSPAFLDGDSLIGGAERYATQLALAMADRVPTRLVSFGKQAKHEQWGKLEVHIYKPLAYIARGRFNPFSVSFLNSLRGAGVIHCHQLGVFTTMASTLYAAARKIPVFVTPLGGGEPRLERFVRVDDKVRGFLHISQYSAQEPRFLNFRNHVVGGAVDGRTFCPGKAVRSSRVLFVGRIQEAKGVHLLVEALPRHLPLTIVGPVLDAEYFKRLQRLAVGKQVQFRHDCTDSNLRDYYLRDYYSTSLVTVLPSLPGTELLGLVLLESMACETPIICTAVGGMPETVEDGRTGFVVPPNNISALREKLSFLSENPATAAQMGRQARQKALADFRWERVVDRCLQVYTIT